MTCFSVFLGVSTYTGRFGKDNWLVIIYFLAIVKTRYLGIRIQSKLSKNVRILIVVSIAIHVNYDWFNRWIVLNQISDGTDAHAWIKWIRKKNMKIWNGRENNWTHGKGLTTFITHSMCVTCTTKLIWFCSKRGLCFDVFLCSLIRFSHLLFLQDCMNKNVPTKRSFHK